MARLLPSTAVLLLAVAPGCATPSSGAGKASQAQAVTRAPEKPRAPRKAPKPSPAPAAPQQARREPPVRHTGPPEPEAAARKESKLVEGELFCVPDGRLEVRPPSERPEDVVPFNPETMTAPQRLSGPEPLYTPEALSRRVQGVSLVRCILGREGTVRSCRVLKPLPHMNEAVVSALCASRFTPATHQGQPLDVEHTFNTRLSLP